MRTLKVTFPLLALFAGTRAMAGAGSGLLLSRRMTVRQRRRLGWTLVALGAVSTVPFAIWFLGRSRPAGATDSR